MVTLAMKANISTEVMVATSVADRMFTLQTIIGLGVKMNPPLTTSAALFELLAKNHVSSMYHTLVSVFRQNLPNHEKRLFA
jgi:hypothetical protein